MIFFERPISLACILIAVALVLVPVYQKIKRKQKAEQGEQQT
jgi:TctA family transporter